MPRDVVREPLNHFWKEKTRIANVDQLADGTNVNHSCMQIEDPQAKRVQTSFS